MARSRVRVVVIDDDEATSEGLALILQAAGADVQVAQSAVAALAMIAAFEPAVVFLDLTLPDLSGFELARLIRAQARRQPYLVAVSGVSGEGDRVRAAGIDEYVVKPPAVERLARIVERIAAGTAETAA